MSARKGWTGIGKGVLTYCTIGRLGFIPVVGREVMESAEDILVGDAGQAGRGVGPGDESGGRGRGGHVWLRSGDGGSPG